MITVIGFVVAAAAGTLGRAEAGRRWNRPNGLPVGTLVVNVTGSFAVGLLVNVAPPALTILGVGGLGAYTTFSSFARDTVALIERRHLTLAIVYVSANLALGVAAAAVGVALTG